MRIDHPSDIHMPQLRKLWQDAFGDTDDFLNFFYRTAYFPDHCRCVLDGDRVAAVLYWIDCELNQQKLAYIYAVVTDPVYRGRGLCRRLMENTHELLRSRGYAGTVLVPQQESLRQMYAGMGYEDCGGLSVFTCEAEGAPLPLRMVDAAEFAALRKEMLPADSVIQEGAGLSFLAEQLIFYAGDGISLAAYAEEQILYGVELLGNPETAAGILRFLGFQQGIFRCPGKEKPFAMFCPLQKNASAPKYFGFAFD